jgi:hypothetical protein
MHYRKSIPAKGGRNTDRVYARCLTQFGLASIRTITIAVMPEAGGNSMNFERSLKAA